MKKELKSYLVRFTYDYYCQGYEDTKETVLVHNCASFGAACNRILISKKYMDARDFEDLTIDI